MEISELRHGNIVTWNKIASMGIGQTKVTLHEMKYPQLLDPIKLNEEWLLKFGFEKQLDSLFIDKQGWCIYLESNSFRWQTTFLKHVHQLQNLYHALTGEELKIIKNEKG